MGWMDWLRGSRAGNNGNRVGDWHRAWAEAAADPDTARFARLRESLEALHAPDDDTEIEREMLEGLEALLTLKASMDDGALPVVETGHRIVGSDRCHFSAPVSRADDPAQPTGRLFLTERRAVFAGGPSAVTMAWHGVAEVLHSDREIVLVRLDRETFHRFRCNSFSDAMCGAFIGRRLSRAGRERRARV
jgi:hypothetical protein